MAQNEPQRKKTPPGPSPNSPSLLFEYQCRSGKFIRLVNRIESKKNLFGSENRTESNKNFFCPNWNALLPALWITVYRTASNYEVLFHKSFKYFGSGCYRKTLTRAALVHAVHSSHSLHTVECRLEAAVAVSCCSPWLQSSFILLSVSEPARISCGYTEWELSNKTVGSALDWATGALPNEHRMHCPQHTRIPVSQLTSSACTGRCWMSHGTRNSGQHPAAERETNWAYPTGVCDWLSTCHVTLAYLL